MSLHPHSAAVLLRGQATADNVPLPDLSNDAEMARQGRLSELNKHRRRLASELRGLVIDLCNQAEQGRSAGHRGLIRTLLSEMDEVDARLSDL